MRWLLCAAIFASCSGQADAIDIWLSKSGNPSAPPTHAAAVPNIHNFISQGTGSVFVWARPDDTKTLERWSLRITSSNSSILDFDESSIEAYNLLDANLPGEADDEVRWEFTNGPDGDSSQVDLFGFNIVSPSPARVAEGIGPSCNSADQYCSAAGNPLKESWLLARVDYSISAVVGQSELFFQIGSAGINHEGETTAEAFVMLGHAGEGALNGGTDRLIDSSAKDGLIVVHLDPDADFDTDSDVDGRDFLTWQRGFGTGSTKATGDATNDANVDEVDLAAWQFQHGLGLVSLGALESATVPEPATGVLAGGMLLVVLARRSVADHVRHQASRGTNG